MDPPPLLLTRTDARLLIQMWAAGTDFQYQVRNTSRESACEHSQTTDTVI